MHARALALILCALTITPALAGCVSDLSTANLEPVPGIVDGRLLAFEKVHTPEEIVEIVEGFATLPGVQVDVIGQSVENRPIHKVVLGEGAFELWAVGRHHGNEPTGGEAILQLVPLLMDDAVELPEDTPPILRFLREHRDVVLERVTFVFVPVVNPDGAAGFQRHNVNDQDLNRDYFALSQPETQATARAFREHWPDGCLDLHNEGEVEGYDYDAFIPIKLMESEIEEALTAASWRAVYEVDAAGGFAGGPNENYRLGDSDLERQVVNPTAIHPGTHDMYCSVRGAPGWTPEGAIPRATGAPIEDQHPYAWGARNHMITVAAAALEAAGLYDGFAAPVVEKVEGTIGQLGGSHLVDIPLAGDLTLQVVWDEDMPKDKSPLPVLVEIEDPTGKTHQARMPTPDAFTATVRFQDAAPGTYRVNVKGPLGVAYEVREYLTPEQPQALRVQRHADGLLVENPNPWPVTVTVTDVTDPAASGFHPAPAATHAWNGTIMPRLGLEWVLDLPAGGAQTIAYPEGVENPGPFRWTAERMDGALATGVEAARSTG